MGIQTLDYRETTVNGLDKKMQKAFNLLNQYSLNCRSNYYDAKIKFEENLFHSYIKAANDPESRTPQYLAKTYEIKLERIGMFKLQWLKECQVDFDNKLVKMASKLVEFGMMEEGVVLDASDIEVDEYLGMEFYVSAIQKEGYQRMGRAHARFVWVDCSEKASHYRFIVTYKKDKNYNPTPVVEQEVVVSNQPLREYKGSRKEQVSFLMNYGKSASFIARELGANVSYVRKLMRDIKNS